MEDAARQIVRFPVRVEIVAKDLSGKEIEADRAAIQEFGDGLFQLRLKLRNPSEKEVKTIKAAVDLEQLEESDVADGVSEGSFRFVQVERKLVADKLIIGRRRTAYFAGDTDIAMLLSTLRKEILRESSFPYARNLSLPCSLSADTKSKLFQVPPAASYDLLFTLAVPDPASAPVLWDLPQTLTRYVSPLLATLEPWAHFRARSQVLYLTTLGGESHWRDDLGAHVLPWEQLPLLATPLEARLASHVHAHPRLNFVVCVAPCERSPMVILDKNGKPVETNAFVLPQWGGVQVINIGCGDNSTMTVDTTMAVMLQHLRLLLGLDSTPGMLELSKSAIRDWERDYLLRLRAAQNLCSVGISLKSLAQLLGEISGIVINEEVGSRVHRALDQSDLARQNLAAARLSEGQEASREAFVAAEGAFHDPSLLALLYFPEDQKYAIYIPLFLPVGIPVALSLQSILTWISRKWRGVKAKTD